MAGYIDEVISLASLAASGYSVWNQHGIHCKETAQSKVYHAEAINVGEQKHVESIEVAKEGYITETKAALEQHFQLLNADLNYGIRESERDMFDQTNHRYQTIILASSVMFAALSTVIIQGYLPQKSSEFIFVSYALSSSLSFAFLFLSIVLCIEVLDKASKHMYKRAKKYTDNLNKSMQDGKILMNELKEMADAPKSSTSCTMKITEELWRQRDDKVKEYLEKRRLINIGQHMHLPNSSSDGGFNNNTDSFNRFWEVNCKLLADWAMLCFFIGALTLLLAIMIFMWSQFTVVYSNISGGAIAVILIGISLLIGIALIVSLKMLPAVCLRKNKPN